MTLRMRLTLAFLVVVLVPLAVGAVVVTQTFPTSLAARQLPVAVSDAQLVAQLLHQTCERARTAAEATGRLAATTTTANARAGAESFLARGLVQGVAVLRPSGVPVFAVGSVPAGATDCTTGVGSMGTLAASVPLLTGNGAGAGSVVATVSVVPGLLAQIDRVLGNAQVVLVTADGTVVAGFADVPQQVITQALANPQGIVRDGQVAAAVAGGNGQPYGVVVLMDPTGGRHVVLNVMAVLLLALVGAAGIALLVARATTRPLEELDAAATRVAAGDLSTLIPVRSKDEIGRLAETFNAMTRDLRTYIDQLRASRDDLHSGLARLGEMLAGSHDLDRLLSVVLESAVAQARATGGMVLLMDAERQHLRLVAVQGLDLPHDWQVPTSDGVPGAVATHGNAVRGRTGQGFDEVTPAAGEPAESSYLGVPLKSSGKVIGVLALYGSTAADGFADDDLSSIRTLADQATIAVDNVRLHEEAQRLSLTDAMTGLWNYRYFTTALTRELERAHRFGRPLALVMIDLDHFKDVNDNFGHQRGDEVLIELAARLRGKAREVDTVARYGGEELVLILPETDAEGASSTADRLCAAVRQRPFGGTGEPALRITVSAGVAVYPQDGTSAHDLIASADAALYEAKHAGRDTFRMSGSVLDC